MWRRRIGANIVSGHIIWRQNSVSSIAFESSAEECWPIMFNAYAVLNFEQPKALRLGGYLETVTCSNYAIYRRFLDLPRPYSDQ